MTDDGTASAELPCADKLAFDTLQQARTAATVAEYQRGLQLTAYHCRYCDLFHLSYQLR